MKKAVFIFLLMVCVLGTVCTAKATVIIEDDFDDGVLDSAWAVSFENSSGWNHTESGTNLTATDIASTIDNPGGGGTWSNVTLSRSFIPLSDFHVKLDFSWDEMGSMSAIQQLRLILYDCNNNSMVWTGFYDAWISYAGKQHAYIGDINLDDYTGPNLTSNLFGSLPLTGSKKGSSLLLTLDQGGLQGFNAFLSLLSILISPFNLSITLLTGLFLSMPKASSTAFSVSPRRRLVR
jgi:hypothetical protein